MKSPITLSRIEYEVMRYYSVNSNIIVPNTYWHQCHECDLLIVSKAGYATEIEIKTNLPDLRRDKEKLHAHRSSTISRLYFALPYYLEPHIEHVPERAGIFIVRYGEKYNGFAVEKIRKAKRVNRYKLNVYEQLEVARLGCMRLLKHAEGFADRDLQEYHEVKEWE